MVSVLEVMIREHPTTLEEDQALLDTLSSPPPSSPTTLQESTTSSPFNVDWKLTCALYYRMERKRILLESVCGMSVLLRWMTSVAQGVEGKHSEQQDVSEREAGLGRDGVLVDRLRPIYNSYVLLYIIMCFVRLSSPLA
jgi:hypothetical protein